MSKKYTTRELAFIVILLLLPLLYLWYVYPALPATVPTHFNKLGMPNAYNPKSFLWFIVGLLTCLGAGIYFLLKNLPAIDPKRVAAFSVRGFQKIGIAVVTMLSAISMIIVYAAGQKGYTTGNLLFFMLGLFFTYLGNVMYSIKPNYFVGIRLPWTLESEDNWRATHRLGSKLFFVGGIVIMIASLVLRFSAVVICVDVITGLVALIPCLFSFLYFKKHRQQKS